MSCDKVQFRHCILCDYQMEKCATEAAENLCRIFGPNAVSTREGAKVVLKILMEGF